jgi:uncharacterized membrane protein
MLKYIVIFFLFSFIGWLYEYTIFNKKKPDGITKKLFNINLPILPIYGFGGIILLLIHDYFEGYPIFIKIIFATIILNIMECIAGLLSYKFYGYQTWNYNNKLIPICNGYISLGSAFVWMIATYSFFTIFDKIKLIQKK